MGSAGSAFGVSSIVSTFARFAGVADAARDDVDDPRASPTDLRLG